MYFVIGGLAGAGATVITNPMDVVKTRLQLQGELQAKSEQATRYRGIFHGLYVIGRTDGVLALQKGLLPAMMFGFTMNSVRIRTQKTVIKSGQRLAMESENTENIKSNKANRKGKQVSTKNVNVKNEDDKKPARVKYKKKDGTSGATGQLYESKLLSLILFRCLTDDDIEEFLLGSNMVGVGDLDDICLRFTFRGKQIAAFIQSKHKDDSSKGITDVHLYGPKSKVNLLKCFDSYLQTRNQFNTHNDKKDIFRGNFEDVELHFIVYTSAVNKLSKKKIKIIDESDWFSKLRKIISCKDRQVDVVQLAYDDNDVKIVSNVLIDKQIEIIAKDFIDCFRNKQETNFEVFRKYLNILVPDVVNFTEDEACNVYVASINPNLFYATDEIIIKLRQSICKIAVANSKLDKEQQEMSLWLWLYGEYDSDKSKNLIKIIGNTIIFDDKKSKLIFNPKVPQTLVTKFEKRLNYFNYYFHEITKNMVDEATQIAGKKLLQGDFINIPKWIIDLNDLNKIDKKLFFAAEINVAEDFLRKLYFFTNQGQEKDVADKLVIDMSNHFQQFEKQSYKNRTGADIAFLKFHDKVQKWWLLNNNSYYQLKTCDYLDQLPHELSQPFVDLLDFKYRHEITKHSVEFKPESIDKIKFNSKSKITNVVTRSFLLTCIKLQQFFDNFIYIDFQHLYYLRDSEWAVLREELQSKMFFNLVLVYKEGFKNASETINITIWLLGKVIDAFLNNIVIVSNDSLNVMYDTNFIEVNELYIDENITFGDLTTETQDKLLQYEIDFQGELISLKQLLGNDSCIINTDIIHRILDNTSIVLGQNLSIASYENIKDLYVPRTLVPRTETDNMKPYDIRYDNGRYIMKLDSYVVIRSFKDSGNDMNIIAAEPGMGKSTMLTHLSIETKKQYPEIWIVRLNLLDYCDDFKNMKAEVNQTEFLKLILKSQFGDIDELIDDNDGEVSVKYSGNDNLKLFELETMMYCYNSRNMIFVFDGFDEICPNYQPQVTSFIKNAENGCDDQGSTFNLMELFYASDIPKRFQVWLTSRPYNVIIQQLEKHFGPSFILKSLSEKEQNYFYDKYWSANFKANETDMQQFRNIESFFIFMSQFRNTYGEFSDPFHATDVPLYEMYISAVRYFRNQILHMPLKVDKEKILNDWITDEQLRLNLASFHRGTDVHNAQKIVGVPLYMDMAASYFVSEIKNDKEKSVTEWDLGFTTFGYYKRFVELKLQVRFVQKNDMKISRPDVMSMCNTERNNFMNTHKKLAFYAMMHRSKHYLKRILTKPDMINIKKTIKRIENGKEKTGLIERIHNGVPRFVHLTFAEYLSVEFIVDKIIAKKPDIRVLMDYIINHLLRQGSIGLRTIFNQKLRSKDKKLNEVLSEPAVKKVVFDLMMEQKDETNLADSRFDDDGTVNIEPSLYIAIDNRLDNVVMFLISSLNGNLNEQNIDSVIEYYETMCTNRPEFISYVLDRVKKEYFDTKLMIRPELIEYALDRLRLIYEKIKSKFEKEINDEILKM